MDRSMVSTKTVLVVTIVDSDLDGNTGIYETNDRRWYSNKVGVSSICGTGEARILRSIEIQGDVGLDNLPSNIGH
jgi:hypothetical protein